MPFGQYEGFSWCWRRCFSIYVFSTILQTGLLQEAQAMCLRSTTQMSTSTVPPLKVRIHFVRHGETQGNHAGIVLGQIHSPLTPMGIQQARAAHKTIGCKPYWRCYVSNQERAFQTAYYTLYNDVPPTTFVKQTTTKEGGRRTLCRDEVQYTHPNQQDAGNNENERYHPSLILEPRLRERAKGVREGRDKKLSYKEAMVLFEREQSALEGGVVQEEIPKLETEQDVWRRVHDWMMDIWKDAHFDFQSKQEQPGKDCSSSSDDDMIGIPVEPCVYNVLAVSHSGTMRTAIEKMVGSQLPSNIEREETDRDGDQVGRLLVPNTSVTTIELNTKMRHLTERTVLNNKEGEEEDPWDPKLLDFINVSHLNGIQKQSETATKKLSAVF